jgi:hypothetical protein
MFFVICCFEKSENDRDWSVGPPRFFWRMMFFVICCFEKSENDRDWSVGPPRSILWPTTFEICGPARSILWPTTYLFWKFVCSDLSMYEKGLTMTVSSWYRSRHVRPNLVGEHLFDSLPPARSWGIDIICNVASSGYGVQFVMQLVPHRSCALGIWSHHTPPIYTYIWAACRV